MTDFGNIELYRRQAIDNAVETLRGHVHELEQWDESFGPHVSVDEILERSDDCCGEAFSNFLRYLLRRCVIPGGRFFRVEELAAAFAEEGVDASGLLTVTVKSYVIPQQGRDLCGKRIHIKNTVKGIQSVHINRYIIPRKLCRIRARDFVDCFLKALEADSEMKIAVKALVMAEKIARQTRKNSKVKCMT